MKSSIYTSVKLKGGEESERSFGRITLWWNLGCCVMGVLWVLGSNGWSGRGGWAWEFDKSAHVSVKAQKYGGLSAQPIGRLNGRPISGS
jgi:hypothetical protein